MPSSPARRTSPAALLPLTIRAGVPAIPNRTEAEPSLLDLPVEVAALDVDELAAEHGRQQAAVAASGHAGRLRLLLAAESAGALVAAELTAVGLPFDESTHDALLQAVLGPQPLPGGRPAMLESLRRPDPDRLCLLRR